VPEPPFAKGQPPDPSQDRVLRLTPDEIRHALAFAVRDPEAFILASHQLEHTLFESGPETHFMLFWRSVRAVADASGGVLPADPIAAGHAVFSAMTGQLAVPGAAAFYPQPVVDRVVGPGGLLDYAFREFRPSPEGRGYGLSLLGRFLAERKLSDELRRLTNDLPSVETYTDPLAVLRALEARWTTVTLQTGRGGAPAVADDPTARPALPRLRKTLLPWLDEIMNGGQADGEAYCLLGPTSGGKTSLAVQLAVEGTRYENAVAADGGPARYWHYFSWEASYAELMQRVYSYGAKVHADTYRHNQEFSTAANRKAYEYEEPANGAGLPVTGEVERLHEFAAGFGGSRCRLLIHDFSGSRPGLGTGGLQEAIDEIRLEAHRGRPPAGIVIDYAGICLERQIAANPGRYKPSDVYVMLGSFMDQVRNRLSIPYSCSSWVLHQFHGDQSGLAPGVALHHKNAKGSRNIGDNADFAFGIGNRDNRTGMLTFSMSKHRRAPGRTEPTLVHFDGRFNRFSTRPGYQIDAYSRRIVEAAEFAAIDDNATPPPPPDAGLSAGDGIS
jgi:hypothetical protein